MNKAASQDDRHHQRHARSSGHDRRLHATVTAVAPGVGLPTGTVQFRIDGVNVGAPVALNASGQAAFATSTMTVGRHVVTAVYSGDGNFNADLVSNNRTQRIR